MSDQTATPTPPMPVPEDSRITIVLDGKTSTPKAIDFYQVNAFQLLAIGEWLLLKGKQMITMAEEGERTGRGIMIPEAVTPPMGEILRASK